MSLATVTPTQVRPRPTSLASPAVLRENFPDSTELVFVGSIEHLDGSPVRDAVLELLGIRLRADERGTFELLMECPAPGPSGIVVRINAPAHEPVDADLRFAPVDSSSTGVIPVRPGRLVDGTLVLRHDFVLTEVA